MYMSLLAHLTVHTAFQKRSVRVPSRDLPCRAVACCAVACAGTTMTGCWPTWVSRAGQQQQHRGRMQQCAWHQVHSMPHWQVWLAPLYIERLLKEAGGRTEGWGCRWYLGTGLVDLHQFRMLCIGPIPCLVDGFVIGLWC
jgi:hypothetical protein